MPATTNLAPHYRQDIGGAVDDGRKRERSWQDFVLQNAKLLHNDRCFKANGSFTNANKCLWQGAMWHAEAYGMLGYLNTI